MATAKKSFKRYERVDNRPVVLPSGIKAPTEADRLHGMMSRLIVDLHGHKELESFEESMDFETGDDDGEELFARAGVSPSEIRYMKEENMLAEATEAGNIRMQRSEAAKYRKARYGKASVQHGGESGASGVDGGVSKVGAEGSAKAGSESGGVGGVRGSSGGSSSPSGKVAS